GDDTDHAVQALEPFLKAGPVLDQRAQLAPYPAILVSDEGPHQGHGLPISRSALLPHLDEATTEGLERLLTSGDVRFMQLRQVGGAINDVPADAMAYAHRSQNFSLVAMTVPRGTESLDAQWA